MTRDIVLDVVANNRASRAFAELADDVSDAGGRAAAAATEFDRAGQSLQRVDATIGKTRTNIRGLAVEFARTGDVDVWAKMRDGEKVLRDLEKVRRAIGDVRPPDPEPAGRSWGARLADGMVEGMQGLPLGVGSAITKGGVAAGPVAAGVGVALAGTLILAANAAILTAGGGVGLAAGIMAAAKSPETEAAVSGLKAVLAAQMADAGRPFIRPLVDAIGLVRNELGTLGISDAIRPMADALLPLTAGVMGMVRNVMPGLRAFFEASREVIVGISAELPELGEAIGDMLEDIATSGPAALSVFQVLLEAVEGTAQAVGALSMIAAAGMAVFGDSADKAAFAVATANARVDEGAGKTAFAGLRSSTAETVKGVNDLVDSLDRAHDRIISGMNAEVDWQAAIDSTAASIREHGATMDVDTESGRENQRQLISLAEASRARAQAVYDDTAAVSGSAEATARARDAWRQGYDQVVANARAMGASATEAQNLATKIMGIPPVRSTTITADTSSAMGALSALEGRMSRIGRLNVIVQNGQQVPFFGPIAPRATGGPVKAGRPYIVGERRPELFVPAVDGYVEPKVPEPVGIGAMVSASRGGGGAQRTYQINVSALDGRAAANAVMDAIQAYERANGASWRAA